MTGQERTNGAKTGVWKMGFGKQRKPQSEDEPSSSSESSKALWKMGFGQKIQQQPPITTSNDKPKAKNLWDELSDLKKIMANKEKRKNFVDLMFMNQEEILQDMENKRRLKLQQKARDLVGEKPEEEEEKQQPTAEPTATTKKESILDVFLQEDDEGPKDCTTLTVFGPQRPHTPLSHIQYQWIQSQYLPRNKLPMLVPEKVVILVPQQSRQQNGVWHEIAHDFTRGDQKILRAIGRTALVNAVVMATAFTGGAVTGVAGFATGGAITAKRLGDGLQEDNPKEVAKSLAVFSAATTASITGQAVAGALMITVAGAALPVAAGLAFGVGCTSGICAGALSEWGVDHAWKNLHKALPNQHQQAQAAQETHRVLD